VKTLLPFRQTHRGLLPAQFGSNFWSSSTRLNNK
jgi:hypothetical protein